MTHALILMMAFASAFLAWLKLPRSAIVLGLVTLATFLAVGYGLLARPLLALQDGYDTEVHSWGQHNAILLLGAGSTITDRDTVEPGIYGYARFLKALEVYHACKAHVADCKIIATGGGDVQRLDTSEAQVFASRFASVGVPSDDVLVEGRSDNTWQNAKYSAAFFAHHRFDRAYLVTSGFHLPRATLDFAHFGIPTTPVRADYGRPRLGLLPLSSNFYLTDVALHEHLGLWRDSVYKALGWYESPTKPNLL
jgi:uncharacterized SAM-binding protein YcdF (DUF218 family)